MADSNFVHRTVLAETLRGLGLSEIHFAKDGQVLPEVLSEQRPTIVLLSWSLAKLSGPEATRAIRAGRTSAPRALAIIATTAAPTRGFVAEAELAGADEILAIPFRQMALTRRLEAVVLHKRPFVESVRYVGPCRRRRDSEAYKGPRRRFTDPIQIEVAPERGPLMRAILRLREAAGGLPSDAPVVDAAREAALEVELAARALGDPAIAETARSLARYLLAAQEASALETDVLFAHVDAMHTLCVRPAEGRGHAEFIVGGLTSAVDRRVRRLRVAT